MGDGSENSEDLLEDDGSDRDVDSDHGFEIGNHDLQPLFGIEPNDLENDSDLVFDIESHSLEDKDQVLEFETNGHDLEGRISKTRSQYPPPVAGMEFDSYDDAYKYYNCYAKELGFAIRVKSSWTKRNSKDKRGAVLCCNCEGFKTLKEANSRRKETRTGCLAMIRLRLVESNRWRVDEFKPEHNHSFDPDRARNSKSHKRVHSGAKRKLEPTTDFKVQTIKLYRTPAADAGNSNGRSFLESKRLDLKPGDAQVIHDYFCRVQLTNPNFFYVMDFADEGYVRNVFWIDSRSRASYAYFGDVVALDTTCLRNKYRVPVLVFVGVNHHGRSISLGCGLLADESQETYTWLLRAWLTCMYGRPPQTVITDRSKTLQCSIAEVFPRAHHRFCLPLVVESVVENFGSLETQAFQTVLNSVIYDSMKAEEFEAAWEDMTRRFGIGNNEWLRKLFEDRERWAPVYSKDTFFAGMFTFSTVPFLDGYVHPQTSFKEFFEAHDLVLRNRIQNEALDDRESTPDFTTTCRYESQLSKLYTKAIFERFRNEVETMPDCLSVSQVHASGPIVTYAVTEREPEGTVTRNLEVMYDKTGFEIRCGCGCFNLNGYLCRHALSVLSHNGVEEVPSQFILARWRKDFKRLYGPDRGSDGVDVCNPVQWFVHLHKRALQVVEEGMASQEHYMVAWQAFKESLNKVRLVADERA